MTNKRLAILKKKYLREGYKMGLKEAMQNTQRIKDGDIIYFNDGEFEGVDIASDCNEEGCFPSALGVELDWSSITLLMTKSEFMAKIRGSRM